MFELLTSLRVLQGLYIGFARRINNCQEKFFADKKYSGRFYVRIFLGDLFGFVEDQENSL